MEPTDVVGHLVECRTDPDGKEYWIDYRPSPPTWQDPRADPLDPMPPGIQIHCTPDDTKYYIDTRPKLSWTRPANVDSTTEVGKPGSRSERSITEQKLRSDTLRSGTLVPPLFPGRNGTLSSTVSPLHPDLRLLLALTRWRFAQSLSGYPDARVAEVDTMINLLNIRISAFDDISELRPLEQWFHKGALDLISSRPNINFLQPHNNEPADVESKLGIWQGLWEGALRPIVFLLLLGVPPNYKRRLGRADWIQWASSKRWTDQQQAMDGFLRTMISEWNLMILLSTLILSTSVGFLAINDLPTIAETTILISLVFSLASIVLDAAFVWRYQRQLTNNFDMRAIMNEFIFTPSEDVLSIFLSLPMSFLLWSVVTFSAAVLSYAWTKFSVTPASPIGVTATACFVFGFTTITWALHRWLWKIVPQSERKWRKWDHRGRGNRGARTMINLDSSTTPSAGSRDALQEEPDEIGEFKRKGALKDAGGTREELKPLQEAETA
ncbi:hypothetical protein FRB90_001605 [Tulasnella sp. 427]|nr:hypothetical protein FRB90_001605 [Tulasnella sp. 427]